MLDIVSYCAIVIMSLRYSTSKMLWPWNPGQRSLKWYHSIELVWFPISVSVFYRNVPKMHHFWDIWLQKCRDLWNWVRGPLRSLEMSPCDRAHDFLLTFYSNYGSISCRYWDIQCSKNVVTLKSGSEVTQGHWKRHHSVDRVWFPISFFSNFVPKMHRFWDFPLVTIHTVTLKPRLGVTQGHRRWYHLIRQPWLRINVP